MIKVSLERERSGENGGGVHIAPGTVMHVSGNITGGNHIEAGGDVYLDGRGSTPRELSGYDRRIPGFERTTIMLPGAEVVDFSDGKVDLREGLGGLNGRLVVGEKVEFFILGSGVVEVCGVVLPKEVLEELGDKRGCVRETYAVDAYVQSPETDDMGLLRQVQFFQNLTDLDGEKRKGVRLITAGLFSVGEDRKPVADENWRELPPRKERIEEDHMVVWQKKVRRFAVDLHGAVFQLKVLVETVRDSQVIFGIE